MRQGCISLGMVQCDNCKVFVPHGERYLLIDDEEAIEAQAGKRSCYCLNCSLEKGLAEYREEKGERVLTFFPGETYSV